MWIALALCAIIFWLAIFFTFFQADEEALAARFPQRKGKLPDLDVWVRSSEHDDGSYEEERFLLHGRKLYRQTRTRSSSGEIIAVLGEERVR